MERTIVGLDLGTYSIKAAAARMCADGTVEFLGVYDGPARGVSRGNIVDLAEASGAVETLMNRIKEEHGRRIFKVILSVGGAGFSHDRSLGSVVLHGSPRELVQHDVEKVVQSARNMSFSLDRFILHEIVEGYVLDGQEGVKNPLGLFTKKLEVKLYTLFHNLAYIQNATRCINYAGYDVERIVFSGLAAAGCIVSDDEMADGVLFIDVGHATTKMVAAVEGRIKSCSLLNSGGSDITRALSTRLKVPLSAAERLKRDSNVAPDAKGASPMRISISNRHLEISRSEVTDIVTEEVEEFLSRVKNEVDRRSLLSYPKSGIVLSGGGIMLEGLPEKLQGFFNSPVRVGSVRNSVCGEGKPSHIFASSIGALERYAGEIRQKNQRFNLRHPVSRLTHRITNFLNDYF